MCTQGEQEFQDAAKNLTSNDPVVYFAQIDGMMKESKFNEKHGEMGHFSSLHWFK